MRKKFRLLVETSDSGDIISAHWDGNLLIRPHPGSLVAVREYFGGGTVVFELGLPRVESGDRTIHFEGWTTGRGPGWKGKEFEFVPSALAVAGVVRKKGLSLLDEFSTAMGPGTVPASSFPVGQSVNVPASPSGGTPLASSDAAPTWTPETNPNHWTDRRLARMPFPFQTMTTAGPATPPLIQRLVADAVRHAGFEVVMDEPPVLDGRPATPSRFDRHRGLVVGERGLHVDLGLRRRTQALFATSIIAAIVIVALATLEFSSTIPIPYVALVTGLLLGVALVQLTRLGAFDSDIVWVEYSVTTDQGQAPTDRQVPYGYSVRIGAGSVSSQNWSGHGNSGRSVKRLRPSNPSLSRTPRDVADAIGNALST